MRCSSSPTETKTQRRSPVLTLCVLGHTTLSTRKNNEAPTETGASVIQSAANRLQLKPGLKALNSLCAEVSLRNTLPITLKKKKRHPKAQPYLNSILIQYSQCYFVRYQQKATNFPKHSPLLLLIGLTCILAGLAN